MAVQRIDTNLFSETISSMEKVIQAFQSARTDVSRATDGLIDTWQGDGKKAFDKVYKRLKTELEDEETNLITIKDDLQGILNAYTEWDTSTASNIKGE